MFRKFLSRLIIAIKRKGFFYTIKKIPQKIKKQRSIFNFHRTLELNKVLNKCSQMPDSVSYIANYPLDLNLIERSKVLNALCFGIYDDVEFELKIHNLGFNVYSYDPTPVTKKMFEGNQDLRSKITHHDFGVWTQDGLIKFYETAATEGLDGKEYSIINIDNNYNYLEMECKKISTIINDLKLKSIDYMKLDIEGAVPAVLNSYFGDKNNLILPKQISFELEFPKNSKCNSFKEMIELSLELLSNMEKRYDLYYLSKEDLFSQLIIYARIKQA